MKKNSYATADECVLKLEVTKRTFLISITPDCNRGVRQSEREREINKVTVLHTREVVTVTRVQRDVA